MRVLNFLLEAISSFFCALFFLRFFMQWRRIPFYHPFGDFILKLTSWAVLPLRHLIPGIGGFDWASLVAAFLCKLALVLLLMALQYLFLGASFPSLVPLILPVLLVALKDLLLVLLSLFTLLLIVQVVLSWVNPGSPLALPVAQLTAPILAPIRRLIPPISGIDLSPMVAFLILQALSMLLHEIMI
ncbi:MAG: YggT family protein [Zoogloeaceae bacterium]|jgi:YggT family protein|nr:YggT family protein [Zoogloeaceae bacterium]